MILIKRLFLFYSLFIIFPFSAFHALAQDLNLSPVLRTTGYYYDNYKMDKKGEEEEVSFLEVSPILNFDYNSSPLQVNGTAMINKRYFYNDSQPDDDLDQYYSIFSLFRLSDRSTFPLTFSYINDRSTTIVFSSTGESAIGEQNVSGERKDYFVEASPTYEISELANIGFDFGYRYAEFSGDEESEITIQNIGLFYTHHLKNTKDTFTLRSNYSVSDQETEKTYNVQFGFAWLHEFSPTASLEVLFGGHITKETSEEDNNDIKNLDPTVGFVLKKTYSTVSTSISYNLDTYTSIESGSVQIHSLNLILDWKRTEKLRLYYYSLFYWPTETDFDFESNNPDWINNSSYYGFEPAIFYKLTNNFSLGFHYDYTLYPEADRERNRLWISLDYIWPKKRIR